MNIRTNYLGLDLKHPLVASASPLSHTLDGIRRLEDAGAAAVVMASLFEEQIDHESILLDYQLSNGADSYAEALSYFPEAQSYNTGPDEYLNLIRSAREATDIPIIGSLNGVSDGGWTEYATQIEQAGASAIELNLYYVSTDMDLTADVVEQRYLNAVRHVHQCVTIPVAVKISPFFTALAHTARELVAAGASGLVLFNRFYQPDFDLATLEVTPSLALSRSEELRLPLRWIAILYGRLATDLAITTGVHTYEDVLKSVMAGANVTMMASELLQHGLGRIDAILRAMIRWMEEFEYESIVQMRGSMSQRHVAEPAAFERANYMKVLQSFRPQSYGLDR